ncbi:rho GTPase-activating protein 24 [Synchiropus splendidus]|uniref:rho GTPase-activating protein 24 n=1 Tax=Synchiropus splendidus TaxID=270530 RepID=UPI00237DC932|nr:rho GTPase-activating protein 24 [Synchiropus splendidus]
MGLSCFKSWKYESTGHKGNRDVLASPGSYFFLSNSTGQGDEWLKSLNKGVWIPFTGVFGQRLEETVLYERRYGVRLVPLVVEQCVAFIRERGLQEVGLFRQPGRASLVKELQEAFDSGERPTFDSSTDVHTVASLLKLYLRQLPEPLVPYSRYQDFLLCGRKISSDRTLGLDLLRNLLHDLPVANFNLLNFICQFLHEVQSYSSGNRMSCQNLATVFGPNILRAKGDDPQSIMGGAALVHVLMLELIREHQLLFSKSPPTASACLAGEQCSSPAAQRQPHLHPAPCLRQLSLPLITEGREGERLSSTSAARSELPSGQKRRLGHRYTSSHPDNCFFPAPTCSPQHHLESRQVGAHQNGGGSGSSLMDQNTTQDSSAENWLEAWEGLTDSGGHFWRSLVPEAASVASSEAQEDSTPSVYDNLDRDPKLEDQSGRDEASVAEGHKEEREKACQTPDEDSSWSSCEVLPQDETRGTEDVVITEKSEPRSSHQPCEENSGDEEEEDEEHEGGQHLNSPGSCFSLLSTGSSEVFLPSGQPEPEGSEPGDAHALLAELQQQMDRQRAEYQARIHRLERCNDVLERQVAMLRVRLEQQKRSQSVAQIQIRNMEQAKADADRRNSTLQREMELFFQMYGEIRRREERGGSRERILQSL